MRGIACWKRLPMRFCFKLIFDKDTMCYSFKEMDGELIRKRIAHYSREL